MCHATRWPTKTSTLTDSISAVKAAWGKVAQDIGEDPGYVVAATHGKRAVDNLSHFKPHIKEHEMDNEVTKFEESIVFFADRLHGPGSKFREQYSASPQVPIVRILSNRLMARVSLLLLTREPSPPLSIILSNDPPKYFSFGNRLLNLFNFSVSEEIHIQKLSHSDNNFIPEFNIDSVAKINDEGLEAWQLEAASVDRAIQILPGVKRIIDSIPAGRYAVATSGAKTYGNFFTHLIFSQHLISLPFLKPTAA
jgi:hypothetical protein